VVLKKKTQHASSPEYLLRYTLPRSSRAKALSMTVVLASRKLLLIKRKSPSQEAVSLNDLAGKRDRIEGWFKKGKAKNGPFKLSLP
jgi:hypothetical protein